MKISQKWGKFEGGRAIFGEKWKSPKNEVDYKGVGPVLVKNENLPKMRQILWVWTCTQVFGHIFRKKLPFYMGVCVGTASPFAKIDPYAERIEGRFARCARSRAQ